MKYYKTIELKNGMKCCLRNGIESDGQFVFENFNLTHEETDYLLSYPVEERPMHNKYVDCFGNLREESIGDYLLFAVAYRWISKIIYCANPNGEKNDYLLDTLKNFEEKYIWDDPVENTIQLLYNPDMDFPQYDDYTHVKKEYIAKSKAEPEVLLIIIPTIEAVKYDGNFDYVVMAQSPNYTPASADFIIDILREYIEER